MEQQFGQISATLNQRQPGTFPSDIVQKPPTLIHCLFINTRSGDPFDDLSVPTNDKPKRDNIFTDEPPKVEFEKLTYSGNDYDSNDGDHWVTDDPKYKVQHCSMISSTQLVEKKES